MNAQSPNTWWSTLKSAMLGPSSSCLHLLVGLLDRCTSRLVRLTCGQIILAALRSASLVWLGPYGGADPLGMFPHVGLMFWPNVLVLCFGGFFVWVVYILYWRQVNVALIPKGPSPSLLPITDSLPNMVFSVWYRFFSDSYGTQWCGSNHSVFLSVRSASAYDTRLCVSHTRQSALERGQ